VIKLTFDIGADCERNYIPTPHDCVAFNIVRFACDFIGPAGGNPNLTFEFASESDARRYVAERYLQGLAASAADIEEHYNLALVKLPKDIYRAQVLAELAPDATPLSHSESLFIGTSRRLGTLPREAARIIAADRNGTL
jgi:hypothetical protein